LSSSPILEIVFTKNGEKKYTRLTDSKEKCDIILVFDNLAISWKPVRFDKNIEYDKHVVWFSLDVDILNDLLEKMEKTYTK